MGLVIVGGLLWYLAYGMDLGPPQRATVKGLEAPVEIGWHENGPVAIDAENEHDRYAALGYVHGRERPWPVVLWRQAALGNLSSWFGNAVVELDSLSRHLGLAALARQSYEALPSEHKARLRAYANGMNHALNRAPSVLDEELALLDLDPAPWQPWHTLALERLFAWLATAPPPADRIQQAGSQAVAFFRADRRLRRLLHVHGFQHSAAWVTRDSTGTLLYRRIVHGASALPLLHEVAFHRTGSTQLVGATLPGMPFLWAGQSPDHAWSILPESPLRLEHGPAPSLLKPTYERLALPDEREHLLRIRRTDGRLFFGKASPAPAATDTAQLGPDSTIAPRQWQLHWSGLTPGTDLDAWSGLATNGSGSFQLLSGDGLALQRNGTWQVMGSPQVRASHAKGIVIGNTPWTRQLAVALDTLSQRGTTPTSWSEQCYSAWASQHAPKLVASLDSLNRSFSEPLQSSTTYLRNWNYRYVPSSIAASIFDLWAAAYRRHTGTLPGAPLAPDTVRSALAPPAQADTTRSDSLRRARRRHVQRYKLLAQIVDTLRQRYGSDLSQWRWERVSPDRRYFPVWSNDSLRGTHSDHMARTRYAPIDLPGRGHPSSPCWGTSPIERELPAPAAWEMRTHTSHWSTPMTERRAVEPSGFMSRYLILDRAPPPDTLDVRATPPRTTVLTPPSS